MDLVRTKLNNKNEIDYLFINCMSIIQDYSVLAQFGFSSDYRQREMPPFYTR